MFHRYLCEKFQSKLARLSCSAAVLPAVDPPALYFWAVHFLPLPCAVSTGHQALQRHSSGNSTARKRFPVLFCPSSCYVAPSSEFSERDYLCNQAIDGTGEYQCLTLISLNSFGSLIYN